MSRFKPAMEATLSREQRAGSWFAIFADVMPNRRYDIVSCKEYDQARARHGGSRYLRPYINVEDDEQRLIVYVDTLDGKLVVATIKNMFECYHAKFWEDKRGR